MSYPNVYLGLAKFDKLYRRLVQLRTMLRNIKNIIINKNNFTVSYNIVVLYRVYFIYDNNSNSIVANKIANDGDGKILNVE